jgi:aminoglycoside phosphotransferase family enzyme/predicted kinase
MESPSEHQSIVRWLMSPGVCNPSAASVEHIETHISDIFLAGELVVKLKKRVRYSFLDFSTRQAREHACREEVRLNRRLANDWYLGVASITRRSDGGFEIDGAGEVVDWLVRMRRLPSQRTLDVLCQRGELTREHVEQLVDRLIDFYRSLPPLEIEAQTYIDQVDRAVRENLRDLAAPEHALPTAALWRIHGFQLQLLTLCRWFFEQRVAEGRIVDGHGDLRPEHICFTDPIAIFDCVEFNPDLRRIDVLDELAFLAAECDVLGAEWIGRRLIADYRAKSGDRPPAILFDFYKSYRGCVRAKVAALRADQLDGAAREQAISQAKHHLAVADRAVQTWLRPLVIVVGGAAGTGKTTLATAIAQALAARLLRTDVIRRELFGSGPHATGPDAGVYSPEARVQVYDEMLRRLGQHAAESVSVVLDGTFATIESLRAVERAATSPNRVFLAVECFCRPEVATARIGIRLSEGRDASEASPELHAIQRLRWETWPSDIPQIRIDTEQPRQTQLSQVLEKLAQQLAQTVR